MFRYVLTVISSVLWVYSAAAQPINLWSDWEDANEATAAAVKENDFALADKAARAAVILYREDTVGFRLESYILLVDNAVQIILKRSNNPAAGHKFLYTKLVDIFENNKDYPKSLIDLGNTYSALYLSRPDRTTDKSVYKEKVKLIRRIRDASRDIFGQFDFKTQRAEYYTIMAERFTRNKRHVRRELSALLDRSIALNNDQLSIQVLSGLAGLLTSQFRDHDGAIKLIEDTVAQLGEDKLTKQNKQKLFIVVAAALFMDYGADEAEQKLSSVPFLEGPPLQYDEDGDVKAQPLRRYAPNFRNIRSNKMIILSFDVDREGKPKDIKIINSDLSKVNEQAAKSAIKRWRYLPVYQQGKFQPIKGIRVAFNVQPPG